MCHGVHKILWLSLLPPSHLPYLLTLDAAAQERVMLRRAKKEKARMVGLAVG